MTSPLLYVLVTVCMMNNAKHCKELTLDEPVETPGMCQAMGEIMAAAWLGEHDNWAWDGTIKCVKDKPVDEEGT